MDGETLWVIDDRGAAIGHAVGLAGEGDVILLAGTGHEQSIIHGTQKRPWDDRIAAREWPGMSNDGMTSMWRALAAARISR